MRHSYVFVQGIPYCHNKTVGNTDALKIWTKNIIDQTIHLEKITTGCMLNITFLLPPSKFPENYPFGSDLDNLLKRFLDALNATVLSEAPGKDSSIISINVSKMKVNSDEDAGAFFELIPMNVIM